MLTYDPEEKMGRQLTAPIAHILTWTLLAVAVVGVSSNLWQHCLLAGGIGVLVQFCHASSKRAHEGEYTTHPIFAAVGGIMLAVALWYEPARGSAWLAPLMGGLFLWETGWHRWQHRDEFQSCGTELEDDGYPFFARYWATAGLMVASLASHYDSVRTLGP